MFAATGQKITSVACAGPKDIDLAVKAADKAFRTSWGTKTSGTERGRLIYKLADLIDQHADELSAIESLDAGACGSALRKVVDLTSVAGKPFGHAKFLDIWH